MNFRVVFYLGLFLLFLGLPVGTRAADSAAALLAKHVAFTGWTFGDGTIKTLDTTDTVTLDKDGSTNRSERTLRIGLVYRTDANFVQRGETEYAGFTGNIAWSADENGITVPTLGDSAKLRISQDLFFTDGLSGLPWQPKANAQIDGATYAVARITQADALPIDLYVDPATGAYKRAVFDPGGVNEETLDVLSYGEALPGKKIVTKWRYVDSSTTHALTKIVANASISAEQLHPPSQTASWTFSNSNPFPIVVTPERFIVDAVVNGVPGRFILDTGAAEFFFSDAFAQRAKVRQIGHGFAGGIAGSMKVRVGIVDSLRIGGNALSNVTISYGGQGIDKAAPDGLLGFPLFGAAIVTLDVAGSTLRIQDPATADLQELAGLRVGVDLSTQQPQVPMKINGIAPVNAILDTGAPAHMLFAPEIVTRYNLRMLVDNSAIGYMASHVGEGGISGGYELDECGSLDSVTLGPIVYDHPAACKSGSFRNNEALVGFDFLKGFSKITFGYPQSWIVFTPNSNPH
jgi:hypothetical protein